MNHAFELAQQAIQHLRPELLLLAGKSAEGAATESGKQLISWFRDRLKSPAAQAALTEAETHPDNERRIAALQLQIEVLLEENESFRTALEKLLKDLSAFTSTHQSVTSVGDNNKIAQAAGQGNKINIG
jgi:hypothetical protein